MGYTLSKIESIANDIEERSLVDFSPEYINNPNLTFHYMNEKVLDNYLEEMSSKMLTKLPIVSYLEAKMDSDILYSHPDYLNNQGKFDNLANVNDYKKVPSETINKWYENFEFHNYQFLNYIYLQYINTSKLISMNKNIEESNKTWKIKFEESIKEISEDEKLKEKYMSIKYLINNLNSLKLENLKECLQWVNIISTDISPTIEKNFKLIILLRNDIFVIFLKIENLFKENDNLTEENKLDLLKILFYLSEGFKSFHGFLLLVDLLEKNSLQFKFYEFIDFTKLNKLKGKLSHFKSEKIRVFGNEFEFKWEKGNKRKTSGINEYEYLFYLTEKSSGCVTLSDMLFLYNSEYGLAKFLIAERENLIYLNKNQMAFNKKEDVTIFNLRDYIIGFDASLFKSKNQKDKFVIYDKNTLLEKSCFVKYDEISNKIFNSEEVMLNQVPEEYHTKQTSLRISNYSSSNVSLSQKNGYLYLTYPIVSIQNEDPDKGLYFSDKYIYICDIFFLRREIDSYDPNIEINYVNSVLLKNTPNATKSLELDAIFDNKNYYNNKFVVQSANLISHEGKFIYNLLAGKLIPLREFKGDNTDSNLFFGDMNKEKAIMIGSASTIYFFDFLPLDNKDYLALENISKIQFEIYSADNATEYSSSNLSFDYLNSFYQINRKLDGSKSKKVEKDVFIDVFNVDYDSVTASPNQETDFNNDFSNFLLTNLSTLSLFTTNHNSDIGNILTDILKSPYLVNIEYPTVKLLISLIERYFNSNSSHKLFSCLTLLHNHLRTLIFLELDLKLIFRSESEVIQFIQMLFKCLSDSLTRKKKENEDIYLYIEIVNLILEILFSIFSISYLKHETVEHFLMKIFNENFSLINLNLFYEKPEERKKMWEEDFNKNFFGCLNIIYLLDFLLNSNITILIKNKELNENLLNLLENILNYEIREGKNSKGLVFNIEDNLDCVINDLYVYIYNHYIKIKEDNENKELALATFQRINKIVFTSSKKLISNIIKDNNKEEAKIFLRSRSHTFKLLNLISSYSNLFELDSTFAVKNWSLILEIVKLMSHLREQDENCLLPLGHKLDVIIDNTQFEYQDEEKEFLIDLQKDNKKENYQNLYVQFYVLAPSSVREVVQIASIYDQEGETEFHTLKTHLFSELDGPVSKTLNSKLENIDMNKGIKIKLKKINNKPEETKKVLYKIRIANYKFFDNSIDFYLNPLTNLLNKLLKFFCFYENEYIQNSFSFNKELLTLYNTKLFSGGINKISYNFKEDNLIETLNDDIKRFANELKLNSPYYTDKLKFSLENQDFDMQIETEDSDAVFDFAELIELRGEYYANYAKLFKIFDKLIKIIQRDFLFTGEIPDKLVRAAFFTVIKHEKLFGRLEEQTYNLFNVTDDGGDSKKELSNDELIELLKDKQFDSLFYIWKESSQLRKFYKSKKDEILKNENAATEQVNEYFGSVLKKLEFLYNLKVGLSNTLNENSENLNLNRREKHMGGLKHKNSNNLKTAISRIDFTQQDENSLIPQIREQILTLIHVCKSDTIDLRNMIGGFQYMNLKAKFREISLYILIDIINTVEDSEVKANILSNFYDNFKQLRSIPTIFEKLHGSSMALGQNITSAFHEFLYVLLDQINNQNKSNSFFLISIYLNCLIWDIKGRNFPFFTDSKFFSHLFNNPSNQIIKQANELLYILPEVNKSSNIAKRFMNYSEFRPIDLCHVSKVLTDMFKIYSNLIVKRIVKENKKNTLQDNSTNSLSLVRATSNLSENYTELLLLIFDNFENHFERVVNIFLSLNANEDNFIEYYYPIIEEEEIKRYNNFYNQKKLFNLLSTIFKILLTQDEKIKFVFKNYTLFSKILVLSLYANEKSLKIISQIFKLFFVNNEIPYDISLFTNKFKENYSDILTDKIKDKNSFDFLLDFIIALPNKAEVYSEVKISHTFSAKNDINNLNDIVTDLVAYLINIPVWSEFLINYIIKNLENEIQCETDEVIFSPFKFLNTDLSKISNVKKVATNSKLNLSTEKCNKTFEEKDLDVLVKTGYSVDNKKITVKKLADKKENKRGDSDSEDSVDARDKKKDEYIEEETDSTVVLLKESATRDNIKMNNPNYVCSNNYELLVVDDEKEVALIESKSILHILLNILNKKLIEEKEYSPLLCLNYIRILKYIIKILKKGKNDTVNEFIETNSEFLNKLLSYKNSQFSTTFKFSIISLENLESWLLSVLNKQNNLISINNKMKIDPYSVSEKKILIKSGTKENSARITLSKIIFDSRKIMFYNNKMNNQRIVIPFVDYLVLYSSLNSNEYIELLEKKSYEVFVLCNTGDLVDFNKKQENKMILITDELILSLNIVDENVEIEKSSEKDKKKDRESRKEKNKKESESESKSEEEEEEENVEEEEDVEENEEDVEEDEEEEEEIEEKKHGKIKLSKRNYRKAAKKVYKSDVNKKLNKKTHKILPKAAEELKKDLETKTSMKEFKEVLEKYILKNYNLENCVFVVNNKFFHKFKKNMICVGYDSSYVNFDSIKPNSSVAPISNPELKTTTEKIKDKFNDSLYQFVESKTNSNEITSNKFEFFKNLSSAPAGFKKSKTKEVASVHSIDLHQEDTEDFFEILTKKYDLEDILARGGKDKKKEKKVVSELDNKIMNIEFKDRELKPKKMFSEIFSTFPVANSFRDSITLVNGVNLFVFQQYIRMLKIYNQSEKEFVKIEVDDLITEINSIKLLFYQKYYNYAYFNVKDEFDTLNIHLKKILKSIARNFFDEKEEININDDEENKTQEPQKGLTEAQDKIIKVLLGESVIDYGNNPMNIAEITSSTQDALLKKVFDILFDLLTEEPLVKQTENFIFLLIENLTNKAKDILPSLENIITIYEILKHIIDRLPQKYEIAFRVFKFLKDSVLMNCLLKYILEKMEKEKTEFYIYSLELFLFIITSLNKLNIDIETNPEFSTSIFSNEKIKTIFKSLELIDKKLSSKFTKENIINDLNHILNLRKLELKLPSKDSGFYSLALNSSLSNKINIKVNKETLATDNLICMQTIQEEEKDLGNSEVIFKGSPEKEVKIETNKVLITNDKISNMSQLIFTNTIKDNDTFSTSNKRIIQLEIGKAKNVKKVISSRISDCFIAWGDNGLYYTGSLGGKNNYNRFSQHEELTKIYENEQIVDLNDGTLLTDKYIYIFCDDTQMRFEKITYGLNRISVPSGKKVIGAAYLSKNLVCWTSDGIVFACGKNTHLQISSDGRHSIDELTQMTIPSHLKCVQACVMHESFIFLMKDTLNSDGNCYVYASGLNKNGHYCLSSVVDKKFFLKVPSLADVPIVMISSSKRNFAAVSKSNNLYQCGKIENNDEEEDSSYSETQYEPKVVDDFVNKNIEINWVNCEQDFTFIRGCNRNEENKTEYYIVGSTKCFPSSMRGKNSSNNESNFARYDSPIRIYLFSESENKNTKDKRNDESGESESESESYSRSHSEAENEDEEFQDEASVASASYSGSKSSSNKSKKEDAKLSKSQNFIITSLCVLEEALFFIGETYIPRFTSMNTFTISKNNIDKNLILILNLNSDIPNEELHLTSLTKDKRFLVIDIEGADTEKYHLFNLKKYNHENYSNIIEKYKSRLTELEIDLDTQINSLLNSNSNEDLQNEFKLFDLTKNYSNVNYQIAEKISTIKNIISFCEYILIEKASPEKEKSKVGLSNKIIISSVKPSIDFFTITLLRDFNKKAVEFYTDEYNFANKQVEVSINELNQSYLEEFIKSKKTYNILIKSKEGKEKYSSLEDYIKEKYDKYDLFKFMTNDVYYNIITSVCKMMTESTKSLIKNVGVDYDTFISKTIMNNIKYLDYNIREEYFNKGLGAIKRQGEFLYIKIDRALYLRKKNCNVVDKVGEFTIFSQFYKQLLNVDSKAFIHNLNGRLFRVELLGESASDAGGPFRQIYTDSFENLHSNLMELLIPTPNNASKSGSDRDKWTINPGANSELYLNMFKFLGKLFGYAILSELYAPVSLPSFVWKQILNIDLDTSDLENIDVQSYNSIIRVCLNPEKFSEELESLFDVIDFTCQLSNGTIVDLIPDGKNVKLDRTNYRQFAELYLKTRYNECREHVKAIQYGLWEVIPAKVLRFLSWEDLEEKVSGQKEFDLNLFKQNTIYEGYKEESKVVEFFWQFLGKCTLEEKYLYLKFVWGRSRLPSNREGFTDPHCIAKFHERENADQNLPASHTCYFQIDLPNYSSYEVLREKLLYAMKNSFMISDGDPEFFDVEG